MRWREDQSSEGSRGFVVSVCSKFGRGSSESSCDTLLLLADSAMEECQGFVARLTPFKDQPEKQRTAIDSNVMSPTTGQPLPSTMTSLDFQLDPMTSEPSSVSNFPSAICWVDCWQTEEMRTVIDALRYLLPAQVVGLKERVIAADTLCMWLFVLCRAPITGCRSCREQSVAIERDRAQLALLLGDMNSKNSSLNEKVKLSDKVCRHSINSVCRSPRSISSWRPLEKKRMHWLTLPPNSKIWCGNRCVKKPSHRFWEYPSMSL